jgi:excisionase family DNA binding protein
MERLLARLALGSPPLRVHELADLTGYSTTYLRKLVISGALLTVSIGAERRIPVQEAQRVARDLRLID